MRFYVQCFFFFFFYYLYFIYLYFSIKHLPETSVRASAHHFSKFLNQERRGGEEMGCQGKRGDKSTVSTKTLNGLL